VASDVPQQVPHAARELLQRELREAVGVVRERVEVVLLEVAAVQLASHPPPADEIADREQDQRYEQVDPDVSSQRGESRFGHAHPRRSRSCKS
jgi:hypothetical protein